MRYSPKKTPLLLTVLGCLLASIYAGSAQAQATRTWVSGVGDDANPCSRTAPCKTFAGAIVKTAAGGEVNALDPAGYGAVTVTKSITIDGGGGQVASVLVAGTNGIVIAAAANDVVILRNLRFQGLQGAGNSNAGLSAIKVLTAARVDIVNCDISGFNTAGVEGSPTSGTVSIGIKNTTSSANSLGMLFKPASGVTVNLAIDRSFISNNGGGGVKIDGTAGGTINASISDSTMSVNNGNGMLSITGPGSATVNLTRDTFSSNAAFGVQSNQTAGGSSTVAVGQSTFTNNVSGAVQFTPVGAKLQTLGNNQILGANGSGFSGPLGPQ